MKGEIPVFKRCCCCIPLRYGLLTWGYIKIIAEGLIFSSMVTYLYVILVMFGLFRQTFANGGKNLNEMLLYLTLVFLTLTSLITDLVATIVFIIGGHKKSVKLLRGFYFYSIAMLIVTIVLITSAVCLSMITWISSSSTKRTWHMYMIFYSALFIILALQTYFLLLLRSEVIKLRNIGEFKFVNNAAESECTMKYNEQVAGQIDETETEDVRTDRKTLLERSGERYDTTCKFNA